VSYLVVKEAALSLLISIALTAVFAAAALTVWAAFVRYVLTAGCDLTVIPFRPCRTLGTASCLMTYSHQGRRGVRRHPLGGFVLE